MERVLHGQTPLKFSLENVKIEFEFEINIMPGYF